MTTEAWSEQNFTEIFRRLEDLEALASRLRPLTATSGPTSTSNRNKTYAHNLTFSSGAYNQVSWTAGSLQLADGSIQPIAAGGPTTLSDDSSNWIYATWGSSTLTVETSPLNLTKNKFLIGMVFVAGGADGNRPFFFNFSSGDMMVKGFNLAGKAVTYAKIQDVTNDRLLGRATAGAGDVEEIAYGATPSTQAFGDSAAAGTEKAPSRGDHKHAMPAGALTHTDVTLSRALDTTYTNSSSVRFRVVTVTVILTPTTIDACTATAKIHASSDPPTTIVAQAYRGPAVNPMYIPITFLLQPGWKYRVDKTVAGSSAVAINYWSEWDFA